MITTLSKHTLRCCLLLALLCCGAQASAQRYRSAFLQETATLLSERGAQSTSPGYYTLNGVPHGYEVRCNADGTVVTHIGTPLFNRQLSSALPSPIYDFIERYVLQHQLLDLEQSLQRRQDDRVSFELGDIARIDTTATVTIHDEERNLEVVWERDGEPISSFTFRKSYELVSGLNVRERNLELIDTLRYHAEQRDSIMLLTADTTDVYLTADSSYYIKPGGFFSIEEVTGNTYYERDSLGNLQPLFSDMLPEESFINLVRRLVEGDFNVTVTHWLEGFNKTQYHLPLQLLTTLLEREGTQVYIGYARSPIDELWASVRFVNPMLCYCHLLSLHLPVDIVSQRQGDIKGVLYTYIPYQDLSSLNKKKTAKQ